MNVMIVMIEGMLQGTWSRLRTMQGRLHASER